MSVQDSGRSDEVLAAELSLGLLDPDERHDAEARQRQDPAFARLCAIWHDHAAAMMDGPGVAPGPDLWERIRARLPANDRGELASLRGAVRRWRAAAMGFGVIAAALGGAAVRERQTGLHPPAPARIAAATPVVVILTSEDRQAIVSVSFDPATGRYTVASDAFQAGARSAELWVIPSDNVPRSLGLVPPAKGIGQTAPVEGARRIAPGATLAISLEPRGGSRTGKPTGPVVLSGTV